jgi:DDE superfamily endonuclease
MSSFDGYPKTAITDADDDLDDSDDSVYAPEEDKKPAAKTNEEDNNSPTEEDSDIIVVCETSTHAMSAYLEGKGTDALLTLDHHTCHVQATFKARLSRLGCDTDYIPAGYICVLQPVDVGFNVPFKRHVKHLHGKWCIEHYVNLDPKKPFPIPKRRNIIDWVYKAMDEISPETIRKTFLSIGYYHPEDDVLNLNAELDEFKLENTCSECTRRYG